MMRRQILGLPLWAAIGALVLIIVLLLGSC